MRPSWRKEYLRRKAYFLNMAGEYKERADIKAYLEMLLSLATVSILAIFALRPTVVTIAKLVKEIESKKKTIATMDEKIQNLKDAQSLYNQEKDNITLLEISIPKGPNPDIFTRQIEGLSGKHQIGVTRMSVGEATILGKQTQDQSKKKGEVATMPLGANGLAFSINTTITLEQYLSSSNFLSDFEKLRRPPKIDRLMFNIEKVENKKTLTMSVGGQLPYFTGVRKEAVQ
jgi:hypothetical protein